MALILRPARAADTDALTDILRQAMAARVAADDTRTDTPVRITSATLASLYMIVAEQDGEILAFTGGHASGDTLHLDFLFVAPGAQGSRLGTLLLHRMEDHARALGLIRLWLESDRAATGFYEAAGFVTLDTRPRATAPGNGVSIMKKCLPPVVSELTAFNVRLDRGGSWAFETDNRAAIEAYWAEALRAKPQMWDGRTMKLVAHKIEDGVLSGTCAECDFSSFLAWRDWGAPDLDSRNLFGSAILRSRDGALLYGVMAEQTANAGKIYPPGGNLDLQDVQADGTIDIEAAIYRELEEETGLTRADVRPGPLLLAVDGPRMSVGRVLDVDCAAEPLRAVILRHSATSAEQELADIQILRSAADIAAPMIVPYTKSVARHVLGV